MNAYLRRVSVVLVLCTGACANKPEPAHDKLGQHSSAAVEQDIARAEGLLLAGTTDPAKGVFDRALATTDLPDDLAVRAYLGRAECRLAAEDAAGAFADAQQASLRWKSMRRRDAKAADSIAPAVDLVYGDCALAMNDPVTARSRYERAVKATTGTGAAPLKDQDGLRFKRYLAAMLAHDSDASSLKAEVSNPNRADLVALAARYKVGAPAEISTGVASAPESLTLGSVTVLSRAKWNAHPVNLKKLDPMTKIFRITVHHTAELTTETDERSVEAEIRSIQSGHQNGEGYADIGYHFLIDPAGRIWQGRELKYQGAHAGNAALNAGNIGVCLLGNFEEQSLPARQGSALIVLLEQLRSKYKIPREYVYGHGEIRKMGGIGGTECPGSRVQALVERYRHGGASP